MTTSLPAMALPKDSPRCFACGTACEAVSHAWRDRLPRSPGGSKQNERIELLETDSIGRGCLSQEIEGSPISSRDLGAADRCVYASVSQERRNLPELGRATSGFLYPLRCRVPLSSAMLLSSKGIGRKTQYLHREPYSIGGRNSTTRLDTQPKSDWRPNQHNTIEQNEN